MNQRVASAGLAAYGGVNTTSPVASSAQAASSGTTPAAPSVTTTSGTRLVAFYGLGSASAITPLAGMAERCERSNSGLLAATTSEMRHGAIIGQRFKEGRLRGDLASTSYARDHVKSRRANTATNYLRCPE